MTTCALSLAQGTEVDVLTTCASCLGLGSLAHRRLALGVALALELLDHRCQRRYFASYLILLFLRHCVLIIMGAGYVWSIPV